MSGAGLIERLWALGDRHSPGRVLVLVRDGVTVRWLASLLAERGVVLGLRVLSLETLLRAGMEELSGESMSPIRVLGCVHEALLSDPEQRFAAIADQPSYQRAVLGIFVELERACAGVPERVESLGLDPEGRDAMVVGAFERFRGLIGATGERWWQGQAPRGVLAGREQVSFLRRRAAAVALGFAPQTTARWEQELLDALGFECWAPSLGAQIGPGESGGGALEGGVEPLALRLSCAGPEAEVAAVSRLLRAEPNRPAVVLSPAQAVPRWVARLRHRDVPVRAWVERQASHTAAARSVRSLVEIVSEPSSVRRGALEAVLFGSSLRPWGDVAQGLEIDYPSCPHPGDLHAAWQQQRAASFSLEGLASRLSDAAEASVDELSERAQRFGWEPEQLEQRQNRAKDARRMLAGAVGRLAALAQAGARGLHAVLEDWDLLGRAAVHGVAGPEMGAARRVMQLSARASEAEASEPAPSFAQLALDVDHALASTAVGSWEQSRATGGAAVWVLPYTSVATLGGLAKGRGLPERMFLTGLDAYPRPPADHGLISDEVRSELGLVRDRIRFGLELRILDEVVADHGRVVASWRHRDGTGARRPPGPWIAGRHDHGHERRVGVDVIALARSGQAAAPNELRLLKWAAEPSLCRRIEAIRSHDARELGPHTGLLGVGVVARRPYSASALQRYARLPYTYFVERVVGLREQTKIGDSASALLASEQGQVVHRALEDALGRRLIEAAPMPLNLGQTSEPMFAELLDALAEGYRKRAEHGQSEAIWASERDRWATELRMWWQRWDQRMRVGAGGDIVADASRSGTRLRPEPEVLVPGPLLLATEWSPPSSEVFELDLLGLRTIPFVAAVDRIELDPLRQRVDIVDYKTGQPQQPGQLNAQLRAGAHLQLPLYAHAVNQVLRETPEALRLPGPLTVGALRLEYLRRPRARGAKPPNPEARGFIPSQPLGVDGFGQVWTIEQAAASFTLAFVNAIEAGHFPLLERLSIRRGRGVDRFAELARVIPNPGQRSSGVLPPSLEPLPDPKQAREVVR